MKTLNFGAFPLSGNITRKERHLFSKYLMLKYASSIDNYELLNNISSNEIKIITPMSINKYFSSNKNIKPDNDGNNVTIEANCKLMQDIIKSINSDPVSSKFNYYPVLFKGKTGYDTLVLTNTLITDLRLDETVFDDEIISAVLTLSWYFGAVNKKNVFTDKSTYSDFKTFVKEIIKITKRDEVDFMQVLSRNKGDRKRSRNDKIRSALQQSFVDKLSEMKAQAKSQLKLQYGNKISNNLPKTQLPKSKFDLMTVGIKDDIESSDENVFSNSVDLMTNADFDKMISFMDELFKFKQSNNVLNDINVNSKFTNSNDDVIQYNHEDIIVNVDHQYFPDFIENTIKKIDNDLNNDLKTFNTKLKDINSKSSMGTDRKLADFEGDIRDRIFNTENRIHDINNELSQLTTIINNLPPTEEPDPYYNQIDRLTNENNRLSQSIVDDNKRLDDFLLNKSLTDSLNSIKGTPENPKGFETKQNKELLVQLDTTSIKNELTYMHKNLLGFINNNTQLEALFDKYSTNTPGRFMISDSDPLVDVLSVSISDLSITLEEEIIELMANSMNRINDDAYDNLNAEWAKSKYGQTTTELEQIRLKMKERYRLLLNSEIQRIGKKFTQTIIHDMLIQGLSDFIIKPIIRNHNSKVNVVEINEQDLMVKNKLIKKSLNIPEVFKSYVVSMDIIKSVYSNIITLNKHMYLHKLTNNLLQHKTNDLSVVSHFSELTHFGGNNLFVIDNNSMYLQQIDMLNIINNNFLTKVDRKQFNDKSVERFLKTIGSMGCKKIKKK